MLTPWGGGPKVDKPELVSALMIVQVSTQSLEAHSSSLPASRYNCFIRVMAIDMQHAWENRSRA